MYNKPLKLIITMDFKPIKNTKEISFVFFIGCNYKFYLTIIFSGL